MRADATILPKKKPAKVWLANRQSLRVLRAARRGRNARTSRRSWWSRWSLSPSMKMLPARMMNHWVVEAARLPSVLTRPGAQPVSRPDRPSSHCS